MKVIKISEIESAHNNGWCILWRLGSKERPASPKEIAEFQELLSKAAANKMDIIWNYDVEFMLFDPNVPHIVEDK